MMSQLCDVHAWIQQQITPFLKSSSDISIQSYGSLCQYFISTVSLHKLTFLYVSLFMTNHSKFIPVQLYCSGTMLKEILPTFNITTKPLVYLLLQSHFITLFLQHALVTMHTVSPLIKPYNDWRYPLYYYSIQSVRPALKSSLDLI